MASRTKGKECWKEKQPKSHLKVKLITAILTVCMVLSIIGVGVYAAGVGYNTSVNNGVAMNFMHLDGNVKVSAWASDDKGGSSILPSSIAYDYTSNTTNFTRISTDERSSTNLQFAGADFFDLTSDYAHMSQNAQKVRVTYMFSYEPKGTYDLGNFIKIGVTENSNPWASVKVGSTIDIGTSYYISASTTSGTPTNWHKMVSGREYFVNASKYVFVMATCYYSNPEYATIAASALSGDKYNWSYSVSFLSTEENIDDGNQLKSQVALSNTSSTNFSESTETQTLSSFVYDKVGNLVNFENATWSQIATVAAFYEEKGGTSGANSISYYNEQTNQRFVFRVGDTKHSTISGNQVSFVIVGINHDTLSSDTTKRAALTIALKSDYVGMQIANTPQSTTSYDTGYIATQLEGSVKLNLESGLRDVIKTVRKTTATSPSSSTLKTSNLNLFLFSETEVCGSHAHSLATEGTMYKYFENAENRKFSEKWWLRSPAPITGSSYKYCAVNEDGTVTSEQLNLLLNVRFGFCI